MLGVIVEVRRYVDDSQPGWVECWLTDTDGRERVFIDTREPWGVEATTGATRFAVRPEQLVEVASGNEK